MTGEDAAIRDDIKLKCLAEMLGFDVDVGKRPGDTYSFTRGKVHIWRCVSVKERGLQWQCADLVSNTYINHRPYCDDDLETALRVEGEMKIKLTPIQTLALTGLLKYKCVTASDIHVREETMMSLCQKGLAECREYSGFDTEYALTAAGMLFWPAED